MGDPGLDMKKAGAEWEPAYRNYRLFPAKPANHPMHGCDVVRARLPTMSAFGYSTPAVVAGALLFLAPPGDGLNRRQLGDNCQHPCAQLIPVSP